MKEVDHLGQLGAEKKLGVSGIHTSDHYSLCQILQF
jgi:hypothetical protein